MGVADAWTVLRRRWWLVLGLPVVVALATVALRPDAPTTYEARLRFVIDIPRSALVEGSDEGTAAKVGEALIDDIARVIPSEAFARAVAGRLGSEVDPGIIASELSATDRHRVADVWVTRVVPAHAPPEAAAGAEADLLAIAGATVAELEDSAGEWFSRLGDDEVSLTVIDGPTVRVVAPSLRERLELPLRVALALAVSVGLAFLLHALDPKLYSAAEAEGLVGAPTLGRLPRRPRRAWRP